MPWPTNPTEGTTEVMYGQTWTYSNGGWRKLTSPTYSAKLLIRTIAQLTTASADKELVFRVLDAPEGEVIAYSDGTTYRRVLDNSPVI